MGQLWNYLIGTQSVAETENRTVSVESMTMECGFRGARSEVTLLLYPSLQFLFSLMILVHPRPQSL